MKRLIPSLFVPILGCLSLISLFYCAGPPTKAVYIKEGKEYGNVNGPFRSRWWNYYERGLSFLEGEFYSEAIADLRQAIAQREKDQRMARSYGMHFIDYFPHRELGLAYYETGNIEDAKKELELSISLFPTAKAKYYLDQVRKILIKQITDEIRPPTITLAFKTDEIWTSEDPIIFSGTIEDEHYVAGASIRDVPVFLEGAQKCISFREFLNLPQGHHVIDIAAKNLAGRKTERRILIHVDREGPIITIEEVKAAKSKSNDGVTIKGSVYDEAGIIALSLNGQPISIKNGVEVSFSHTLAAVPDGVALVASDRLGNRTNATLSLNLSPVTQVPVLLACAESGLAPSLVAGLFGNDDIRPPSISLKGWDDRQTVFLEKIYLEGQASDESGIESLAINQNNLLRRRGSHIFFSHMAELEEGKNIITIQAKDDHGNISIKKITVIRKVPKALHLSERLSVTSFPFEERGEVSQASLAFQDNLINALVNRNRFRVIERDRLDLILEEQKLSRSRLIDRRTALQLGRLAAAQSVITGSIIETRTGIEVVARMIDTETSDILATEDIYGEIKDLSALMSMAEGMAVKFHRQFPLVDGMVIQKKEKHIFTDLGQDKIKIQRRLIVYREKPVIHPATGKMCGSDHEIIDRARVTQVGPDMSKAELLGPKDQPVNQQDKVITE